MKENNKRFLITNIIAIIFIITIIASFVCTYHLECVKVYEKHLFNYSWDCPFLWNLGINMYQNILWYVLAIEIISLILLNIFKNKKNVIYYFFSILFIIVCLFNVLFEFMTIIEKNIAHNFIWYCFLVLFLLSILFFSIYTTYMLYSYCKNKKGR